MVSCPECSFEAIEGATFCPSCGTRVHGPVMGSESPTATGWPGGPTRSGPASPRLPERARFVPGTLLSSRYRIVALLGRGGMGEVYRAEDLKLGQTVALKFLPSELERDEHRLKRFLEEIRLARQVSHPHVCRVYDVGEVDGLHFLSMEYVDGEDLASLLRRIGRLPPDKAIQVARELCAGIAAAHAQGILHRDLKPANVMIDGRGRVRISDFGLAILATGPGQETSPAGTPAYMAPEQLSEGAATVRTDLYALGLILYETFTGVSVYGPQSVTELKALHESGPVSAPSSLVGDLDPDVDRVIQDCLEKDPHQRPTSTLAVLRALPGADSLPEILSEEETPSPEYLADTEESGVVSPRAAAACVVGFLIALAGWVVVSTVRTSFPNALPPEVLSVRAADLLRELGDTELPESSATGLTPNVAYLEHLASQDRTSSRWEPLERERPPSILFWRRWSPIALDPVDLHKKGKTELNDPPQFAPGSATVRMDLQSRLIGLDIVPTRTEPPAVASSPDWSPLFAHAGLDIEAFARMQPKGEFPIYCDATAAWQGAPRRESNQNLTVRAGAYRGRVVYFAVTGDWEPPGTALRSDAATVPALAANIWSVIEIIAIVAAALLARRNLQLGRGDRRGAFRIAILRLTASLLEGSFLTPLNQMGFVGLLGQLTGGMVLAHALLHACATWMFYLALEPYVRRLWPRTLVSWMRLVSGKRGDPLMGRDILVASAFAVSALWLGQLAQAAYTWLGFAGYPPLPPNNTLTVLHDVRGLGGVVAGAAALGVTVPLVLLVLLLLFRILLRNSTAAVIATVSLYSVFAGALVENESYSISLGVAIVLPLIVGLVFVLLRFGLVAAMLGMFLYDVISSIPTTLDLSQWYAGRSLLAIGLLAALMIYGSYKSLAGRPLFKDAF